MNTGRPGTHPHIDPRGLIYEAYQMPALSSKDCRTIFLDWALGMPDSTEYRSALEELYSLYAHNFPDHPMTGVIREGLATHSRLGKRRGRHSSRRRG